MTIKLNWVASLIVASLLVACGNPKLTRSNLNNIDVGMRYAEVQNILGEADWCDHMDRPSECRWGNDEKHIDVSFVARRVINVTSTGIE